MIIAPGATLGVLGSGQLGRMFTIAARRMGYRVHTYSPDNDTPTGQIADLEITAPYSDLDRVREFARNVSVVTFEFENVPAYMRRNMELHNSIANVEDFYSRAQVKSDDNNQASISTLNNFLHGEKPD